MPRTFATTNVAIWQDEDFRALPVPAQHLYFVLWTHPLLTYCGVVDWRPGRIAPLAGGWSTDQVRASADCLRARLFLVTDDDTEEALIRSWVKWDGLLKQPRMAISFANAWAAVASSTLRGVMVHEAVNLREQDPTLVGWTKDPVRQILARTSIDPACLPLPTDPFAHGLTPGFGDGFGPGFGPGLGEPLPSVSGSPTPAPAPAPAPYSSHGTTTAPTASADAAAPAQKTKRGTRIPEPFPITPDMVSWAREQFPGMDHRAVTESFVDYWRAQPGARGVKLDWPATWRNWLRRETSNPTVARRPEGPRPGTSVWDKRVGGDQ